MALNNNSNEYVSFIMGGMHFEYDEAKNQKNIEKHGISFKSAARVFFDYDRIEMYDEECPETTPERALGFKRVNPPGNLKCA